MSSAEFLSLTGMTAQDITDMETAVVQLIDDVVAQAQLIAAYDYTSLTTAQQEEVMNLVYLFMNFGN
jgi:hypothetical protein